MAFTQSSSGTLDVQLGGAPSTGVYGSLTITGAAALAGTLQAQLAYGYTPSTTDSFTPVTYGSETGGFSAMTLPSGSGYQFAAAPSFTNVLLAPRQAPRRPRRSTPARSCIPLPPASWASTWAGGTRPP